MPSSLVALADSCVVIPCRFQLDSRKQSMLDSTCKAIWRKGTQQVERLSAWSPPGIAVFDSSSTEPGANMLNGSLNGDLIQTDCTTTLIIPRGFTDDDYYFTLECDNDFKYYFSEPVNIKVADSPSVPIVTPDDMLKGVREGDSVSLRCSAPIYCISLPPILTWNHKLAESKEGVGKTQDRLSSVLTFTASYLHHSQRVSCTSLHRKENGDEMTMTSKETRINVLYPPKNTAVSADPSGPLVQGQRVTLTCGCDATPPVFYTWYHQLTGHSSKKHLRVAHSRLVLGLVSSSDSGRYICEVMNDYGSAESEVSINVMYPPYPTFVSVTPWGPVLEGSSVTLSCSSESNPVANFTWYKLTGEGPGTTVGSGQYLTFENVTTEDNGRYTCEAQNYYGKDQHTVLMDIMWPPKNTSLSVFSSGPVIEGSSVTLMCTSDGKPPVENYNWYLIKGTQLVLWGSTEAVSMPETFNGTYTVSTLTGEIRNLHYDRFRCEGINFHGAQKSAELKLSLQYPPRNTSISVRPSGLVVEGNTVTLTCGSDANPPADYTWTKVNGTEDVTVGSGPSLTFDSIHRDDAGEYSCQGENNHGKNKSGTVTINVEFPPMIMPTSHCVRAGNQINCTCESYGNPSPRLEWRYAGHPAHLPSHYDTVLEGDAQGVRALRISFMFPESATTPTVVCISANSIGSTSRPINNLSQQVVDWTKPV